MQYATLFILVLLMTVSFMLLGFYDNLLPKTLKKRAVKGDDRASVLHEVVRNLGVAKLYLYVFGIFFFSFAVSLISNMHNIFVTTLAIFGLVGLGLLALIYSRYVEYLAIKFAPNFSKIIIFSKPYYEYLLKIKKYFYKKSVTPDIYDKTEVLEFLKSQTEHTKDLSFKDDLGFAQKALTFGDKLVKDHLTPRSVVRFVKTEEPVSTVLMGELHDSGFSRFPVFMDDVDNIVGTLYLKDLVERRMTGKVFSAMSNEFYEIQEDETLEEALKQFLATQHHMFVVRNQFNEVVGVITIEDVIEQMIGRKIIDESDVHDDMREYAEEKNAKI